MQHTVFYHASMGCLAANAMWVEQLFVRNM